MSVSSLFQFILITACLHGCSWAGSIHGVDRLKCGERNALQKFRDGTELSKIEKRVDALRNEMRIRSSQNTEVDAYIVTSYDEHQNHQDDDTEGRLEFISGFSGPIGDAVITQKSAALWTESKYLELADRELECDWKIFVMGDEPTIAMWLAKQISPDQFVAADPKTVPHQLWQEWEREMSREFLKMTKVKNMIDIIWGSNRTQPRDYSIKTHNSTFSGVSWQHKVNVLREHLVAHRCDAMVVTSLTEIAYLLNLRGGDFRYVPVFIAYLIVSNDEVILYTNKTKVHIDTELMLHFDFKTNACYKEACVIIKNYHDFWKDLRTLSISWKRVLLPSMSVFDMGASEAIHSSVNREIILERTSPIITMRAQKNHVEREGMRKAHIRDAVAMCDTFSYLEERFMHGDSWNEALVALEVDRSRYEQDKNKGLSFRTISAFGPNAAKPYYFPVGNYSSPIHNQNLLLVDSGGQYLDGTTSIARTIHLGEPTAEQKREYTNVLMGLIRLSMLVFPDNLKPAEIDTLIRGPLWSARHDYEHLSGHGIGSYLSVEESPINIAYTTKHKYTFKDGYFFTVAPGYYKTHEYGIRLKNVFEVIDTHDKHFSGAKFLAFRVATLVPFETKLIDRSLLSLHEKKWLNEYNARIREMVGDELKKQFKMPTFYWLMNQTEHIREYITEQEYRKNDSPNIKINFIVISLIVCLQSLLR